MAAVTALVHDDSFLLQARLAPSTVRKYSAAYARFREWWALTKAHLPPDLPLDCLFSLYLASLYRSGKGKGEAVAAFYGMEMVMPGVKRMLPRARAALTGYNRLIESVPWPPLPWSITVVLAVWMARRGFLTEAIGTLVSFDCYLRMQSELLPLTREDIAIGDDPRLGGADRNRVHIRLRHTKTGKNKGVEVWDAGVKHMLAMLVTLTPPGQRLFPFTASSYRTLLRSACATLGLSTDYVPHSLRHGGATRDFLRGVPIADICVRGRWAHTKSAVGYIQSGRQLLLSMSIPPMVAQAAKSFACRPLMQVIAAANIGAPPVATRVRRVARARRVPPAVRTDTLELASRSAPLTRAHQQRVRVGGRGTPLIPLLPTLPARPARSR